MDDIGPRLNPEPPSRTPARATRSPNRLPTPFVVGLAAAPVIGLAVFYLWPFLTLLAEALGGEAVRRTLTRRSTWDVVWFTTWQAVISTAITLMVGLAPTWIVTRFDFVGRRILLGLLTAMFVLPTVVMGAAFLAFIPAPLNRSTWAVIAAHVVFNIAVVVRTVGAVWEHLPTDMEWASATLGASPLRTFREITLPLIRPTLTAAGAIVFLFTFTSFGVIRILAAPGTRTIEVEIWRRATQLGEIDVAAVLALVQLAALGLVIVWSTASQRRHSRALDLHPLQRRARPRRGPQRRWVRGIAWGTALLAVTPLTALVVKSFSTPTGWSTRAWTNLGRSEVRPGIRVGIDPVNAIWNSLETMLWATAFAVVIGGLASLAIAAAGRGGRILDAGLMLPVGTSAVTIGFGMLITFDHEPVDWRASWWLVPVGHALVAVPFVVRTVLGVLRAVDPELATAAATLGASPVQSWRETVLPFLWRPLAVAGALAAAISLGEFGATSFLSRSGGETLPIAIERLLGRTGSLLQAQGYVLATLLAAMTVGLVVAVDALSPSGRRREP